MKVQNNWQNYSNLIHHFNNWIFIVSTIISIFELKYSYLIYLIVNNIGGENLLLLIRSKLNVNQQIAKIPLGWNKNKHHLFKEEIKVTILTLMMVAQKKSLLHKLPNDILFQIFDWLVFMERQQIIKFSIPIDDETSILNKYQRKN